MPRSNWNLTLRMLIFGTRCGNSGRRSFSSWKLGGTSTSRRLYPLPQKGGSKYHFFHDLVKRNAAKRSIMAITKNDGSTITSTEEIGHEFVAFFHIPVGHGGSDQPGGQ
ncbi:hypothetical protein Salat_2792200 [Sesamum alatum]|uniref:Uncharacterized protein n=1 Tax=Sesamum alatum TaxID=300844 RepID=A0AAE2C992_9LAMI|nr:hypothetical protein Salat_2792200 [Sesamum alatum]